MKILVTGTSGFIAPHVANKLIQLGHDVVGADIRNPLKSNRFKCFKLDLAEWNEVKEIGEYDVIYHIAGHSAGDLSIENYEEDLRGNTLSTANLIKLAKCARTNQIIYASSMAVYGDQPKYPVTEDMLPLPRVYYGANKLAAEYYLKIANSDSLKTTSLRLFNIYGPGQDIGNLNQGMVSIFLGSLLKNPEFIMRGSPDRFRDFLYIDDTVDGFIKCLQNPKISGEVINLGSGVVHTLGEMLDNIRKYLPFETYVKYGNPSSFDLNRMHADISKATELLGFIPKYTLDEGLKIMVEWALREWQKKSL